MKDSILEVLYQAFKKLEERLDNMEQAIVWLQEHSGYDWNNKKEN